MADLFARAVKSHGAMVGTTGKGKTMMKMGVRRNGNSRRPRHSTNTRECLRVHSTKDIPTATICQRPATRVGLLSTGSSKDQTLNGCHLELMPVREHVTRRHLRTTVDCTRCFKCFESELELNEHLRSQTRCEVTSPCPLKDRMYITQVQQRAIKKRKKNVTGEEKWLDLYRIIFPDVSVGNQPLNPCKSIASASVNQTGD